MATMIDENNSEYYGERLVWNAISDNLPDDVIVYFNREIDGRTYDFCLLIENMGILIIEVKGWKPDSVTVNTPDQIIIDGYDQPQMSPRKQAYRYQYRLRQLFMDQCSVRPLYFNMVCYPFIDHDQFNNLRLDLVSPEKFTLMKEDLADPKKFRSKIDLAYQNEKDDRFEAMTSSVICKIREYYEPQFVVSDAVMDAAGCYSRLRVFPQSVSFDLVKSVVKEYFCGTKEILFLADLGSIQNIIDELYADFKKRNIEPDGQNIKIGFTSGNSNFFNGSSFRLFNFEIYYVDDLRSFCPGDVEITEGILDEQKRQLIDELARRSTFNLQQYFIEHGTVEKNILVQAGAGTGKTYSMVSRIAFLCNRARNPVSDIVNDIALVTFTNDAADNMKTRIRQLFINYYFLTSDEKFIRFIDDINTARISTIHKFALDLLKKDPIYTGLSTEFRISKNEFERQRLYESYLDQYLETKREEDPDFISKIHVPLYDFQKTLIRFTDQLNNKSIDVTRIPAESLGTAVGQVPFFNEVIEQVIKPAETDYRVYKNQNDYIELKECLILLHNVIIHRRKPIPYLKYRYLFIDEFQDTDNVQIDIFKALQAAMVNSCRLFVVGDLKQSIYRFRGATISAFDRLIGNRQDLWEVFSLNTNYRTDQDLLSVYDDYFQKWGMEGYLIYKNSEDQLTSYIHVDSENSDRLACIPVHGRNEENFYDAVFDTVAREKAFIQQELAQRTVSKEERTVAILTRTNWQIENIVKEGRKRNFYIDTEAGGDLYKLESTIDFYKLVLTLSNPDNAVYLTNLLHSNYVGIALEYNRLHGLKEADQKAELIRILNQYFNSHMNRSFERVVKDAYEKPILYVLRNIYNGLMPWKKYSFDVEEQYYYMVNYEYLIERIIRSGQIENITLTMISHYLDVNVKTGQQATAREVEKDNSEIHVICTTVHKSKGLEYGTVILPFTSLNIGDTRRNRLDVDWEDDKLSYYVKFSDSIEAHNSNYDANEVADEQIKEETRVLYVALTRAIRNCIWFKDVDSSSKISWGTLLEESLS